MEPEIFPLVLLGFYFVHQYDFRRLNFLVVFLVHMIFVPTPLEGGGGGTIYSNGFFVHSILADRYNHRRELRLVSLESLSSVEY